MKTWAIPRLRHYACVGVAVLDERMRPFTCIRNECSFEQQIANRCRCVNLTSGSMWSIFVCQCAHCGASVLSSRNVAPSVAPMFSNSVAASVTRPARASLGRARDCRNLRRPALRKSSSSSSSSPPPPPPSSLPSPSPLSSSTVEDIRDSICVAPGLNHSAGDRILPPGIELMARCPSPKPCPGSPVRPVWRPGGSSQWCRRTHRFLRGAPGRDSNRVRTLSPPRPPRGLQRPEKGAAR